MEEDGIEDVSSSINARLLRRRSGGGDSTSRLYTRGTVLGYKRSKSNQYPNTSLVQIEGVNTKEEVAWYQCVMDGTKVNAFLRRVTVGYTFEFEQLEDFDVGVQ
ncbi:hypothetical protein L2E82_02949 [Cichorium intybus]|uniref:Uncharacterized protein n=1 Tax=Cichorium intybus TaxID=13427 RepID=A0ACB9H2R3_CICIN|nr:hypothetical protein L2E82_02949 [Cichorium intybus]